MALQVLRDFIYASGCSDRDHDHEDVKHVSVEWCWMDDSLAMTTWNILCGGWVPQNILSLDINPCTVHFSMIVPCLKCVTFDTAAHQKSDWTQAHRNDRGSHHGCNQCYCLERGKQRLAMATATVEDNDLARPCDQRQETQFWWFPFLKRWTPSVCWNWMTWKMNEKHLWYHIYVVFRSHFQVLTSSVVASENQRTVVHPEEWSHITKSCSKVFIG